MRRSRVVMVLALLSSVLVVAGVGNAGTASAAPEDFEERWCVAAGPRPCLESATLNGVPVTETDTDFEIEMTGELTSGANRYFQWQIDDLGGPDDLEATDTWGLTFDTGTIRPRYTEGYSGLPVTLRSDDGTGTFHLTYTARPVLTAFACSPQGAWPTTCPTVAPDDAVQVMLYGEVQSKAGDDEFWGFDVGQNVDEVNGPFLETAADGSQYLEAFVANSHAYDGDPGAGVTAVPFSGQVRWRIPYAMLRDSFGVPDPETMVPKSLTGSVRKPDGTTSPATFVFSHDAGAWLVDVSDIGFSRKVVRVRRGVITPTMPTQVSATRTGDRRGFVDFEPSSPRGAEVTGYAGRCEAVSGNHVVTGSSGNIVRLTGLRADKAYDCRVRARSEVGPGPWSTSVRMARTPNNPG